MSTDRRGSSTDAVIALDAWWRGLRALYRPGFGGTTQETYDAVLEVMAGLLDCKLLVVWSVDPVNKQLILRSARGATPSDFELPVLDCYRSFSGEAVENKNVVDFPDVRRSIELEERQAGNPRLVRLRDLRRMVCVPVYNSVNFNQVVAVINLFPAPGALVPTAEDLEQMAADLAVAVENRLRDHCIKYSNRVRFELQKLKKPSREAYSQVLAVLVREALACDEVSVYLQSADAKAVKFRGSAGISTPEALGAIADDEVRTSWMTNREMLRNGAWGVGTAHFVGAPLATCAFVPLRDIKGQPTGIVRCVNRLAQPHDQTFRPFTYDDLAVVEAIGQAFTPSLEVLLAEQKRIERLSNVAHELRVPVVGFNAALGRIRKECAQNHYEFQYDYLENLNSYSQVMSRLLKELELLRLGPDHITLSATRPVMLHVSVIAPAVKFIRQELRVRGFRPDQIGRFERKDDIPALYVDPDLMIQVVLILFHNAIKYFGENRSPADFSLRTEGRRTISGYEVSFKDMGIGVPDGYEDMIFDYAVRAPNASFDRTGEGLGLSIARELVRRHGGDLVLRSQRGPTEFVIELPASLALYPPTSKTTKS
jgi:signal transduction histidine kinase